MKQFKKLQSEKQRWFWLLRWWRWGICGLAGQHWTLQGEWCGTQKLVMNNCSWCKLWCLNTCLEAWTILSVRLWWKVHLLTERNVVESRTWKRIRVVSRGVADWQACHILEGWQPCKGNCSMVNRANLVRFMDNCSKQRKTNFSVETQRMINVRLFKHY